MTVTSIRPLLPLKTATQAAHLINTANPLNESMELLETVWGLQPGEAKDS